MDKDTRKVVEAAARQGFTVKMTNDGHARLYRDGRFAAQASGTPGDRRALKNLIGSLRRNGFIWPERR